MIRKVEKGKEVRKMSKLVHIGWMLPIVLGALALAVDVMAGLMLIFIGLLVMIQVAKCVIELEDLEHKITTLKTEIEAISAKVNRLTESLQKQEKKSARKRKSSKQDTQ